MSTTDFVDYRAEVRALVEHPEDDFRAAFDRVDEDQSGTIDWKELRLLLREVLGREPAPVVTNTFEALYDKVGVRLLVSCFCLMVHATMHPLMLLIRALAWAGREAYVVRVS